MTLLKRESTWTSHVVFVRSRDPQVLEDVADVVAEFSAREESLLDINAGLAQELEATEDTLGNAVDSIVDMGERLKDAESTIDQLDRELGAAHAALVTIHDSLSYALTAQPTGISRLYTRDAVATAARALGLPAPTETAQRAVLDGLDLERC